MHATLTGSTIPLLHLASPCPVDQPSFSTIQLSSLVTVINRPACKHRKELSNRYTILQLYLVTEVVSRSQTAFFRFSLWWQKKGSGDLAIEFVCDEIDRFCRALIAGDEPKRGANYLCGCVSYYRGRLCNGSP